MENISEISKALLEEQKAEWSLAANNYAGLDNVKVRQYDFDGYSIKVQFNPGRIISSSAKVDKKSIEERSCFLCRTNRPLEQKELPLGDFYLLVNPFPIFPEHFTITLSSHKPQLIKGYFEDMLSLSESLSGYTLFYNGPKCGASAPDHFHFQAGNKGFMPLENELERLKKKYGKQLNMSDSELWMVKDGVRNFLILEGENKKDLKSHFNHIYLCMEEYGSNDEEPMLNILSSYNQNKWTVMIFPRAKHRPGHYFEEGEKNILISPASVDMGGVLITPLEKDFEKITRQDIKDIMHEVLLDDSQFELLANKLRSI